MQRLEKSNVNLKSGLRFAKKVITNHKKAFISSICVVATIATCAATFVKPKYYFESETARYLEAPVVVGAESASRSSSLVMGFGVYIDDTLVGVTEDSSRLDGAFEDVLISVSSQYANAVSKFTSTPKIVKGYFDGSLVCDEKSIKEKIISDFAEYIETKISVTKEETVEYTIKTKYDSTKESDYSVVKHEGKNGKKAVTTEITYVNGKKIGEEVVNSEVTKEPVDKLIITGKAFENGCATGSFMWPCPYTTTVFSGYGYREDGAHWGIDINDNGIYGTDIIASDGGVVVTASYDNYGYGHHVEIDHGNGYITRYAHCSDLYVSVGDKVSKGSVIASVGSTGDSEAPHLHFEVIENGNRVDPQSFRYSYK